MDEHIFSLKCAHQRCKDAFTAVCTEFRAATGQHNNDLAMHLAHSLNKHIESFIFACENLTSFIHLKLPSTLLRLIDENISSLRDAHQMFRDYFAAVLAEFNAAGGHHINDIALDLAMLNLEEQHKRFILACENFWAFIDLTVALNTNAVDPKAAPVIPDNAQPPEETEDNNAAAPEETVDQKKAEVLSDLDPNKKA